MQHLIFHFRYTLALLLFFLIGLQPVSAAPSSWNPEEQGRFVTAMTRDRQGFFWFATEDRGLWRLDASASGDRAWRHWDAGNGLGDDVVYALACDRQGRIWAGTLNHGVSVWNGDAWKNYSVLDGPLGERVFDIAVCPTDGDVWIATSAGLTRYSITRDSWRHYTRAQGLLADQIQAIAFDAKGNIVIGTQCDGVALADAANDYARWRVVVGPDSPVGVPFGDGLPGNQINDVLVARDGTIYAATSFGLTSSDDKGKSWQYTRGADWQEKARGQFNAPKRWKSKPGAALREDYVSALAQDGAGRLWIGYRQKGWDVFDPQTDERVQEGKDDYVTSILPRADAAPYMSTYGAGLVAAPIAPANDAQAASPTTLQDPNAAWQKAPLPSPAPTPSFEEMKAMLLELLAVPISKAPIAKASTAKASVAKTPLPKSTTKSPDKAAKNAAPLPIAASIPRVLALNDDWSAQGTWIDRYGRYAGVLCAMAGGGNDFTTGYRASWWQRRGWIGRNQSKDNGVSPGTPDQLRYYVTWRQTDDRRSLQNSFMGGRKQAEWDDHGETYSMARNGPHVYGTIKIPKGQYVLSCYLFNKDGWDGPNRWRDFLLEVKPTPTEAGLFDDLGLPGVENESEFEEQQEGAVSRVRDFRGGVWKRFYIDARDDEVWTVRVTRNYSFCTILSAIMLDPIAELPGPQGPIRQPTVARSPKFSVVASDVPADLEEAALRVMDRLLYLREANAPWYFANSRRYLLPLLRCFLDHDAANESLATRIEKARTYTELRPDIAACLNDVQMFDKRDSVFFSPTNYLSYAYQGTTRAGDKWDDWKWNNQEYRDFIKQNQAKQTW